MNPLAYDIQKIHKKKSCVIFTCCGTRGHGFFRVFGVFEGTATKKNERNHFTEHATNILDSSPLYVLNNSHGRCPHNLARGRRR